MIVDHSTPLGADFKLLFTIEQTRPCCCWCRLFSFHSSSGCRWCCLGVCSLPSPPPDFFHQRIWTWGTSLLMWREPVGGGDKPVALNHINLLKVSDTSYHNIQKLHSLLTSQMFHEQGPKQAIYLINSCAQWFEVLQAFSIESYGTAGVHARERHFSGMFTMKGLEREQSKRVVIRKVLFTFRQNISIKRSTVTIQLVYFMFSHYSGDSQRGIPGATSVVACDCKFPSAKLTKIDCSGVWIQKLFWYPPLYDQ